MRFIDWTTTHMALNRMEPDYKNLTCKNYGRPKEKQHQPLQDLTRPHVESFNYFLHEGLMKAVQSISPNEFALPNGDRITLFFLEANIGPPQISSKNIRARTLKIFPSECRERGITYKGPLQVQLGFSINGNMEMPVTKVIGEIPVMVKSDACNLAGMSPSQLIKHNEEAEEMGGYFIINGIEKIIRMLVLPKRNFPNCIIRPSWKNRGSFYTEYGVSMRCVKHDQSGSNIVLHYLSNGTAVLNFSFQKEMFFVPIVFILKALLDCTDKYIYDELVKGKEKNSFYKGCIVFMLRQALGEGLTTRKSVNQYIGERFRIKLQLPEWYTDEEVGDFLIKNCVCNHMESNVDKFNILVYMTQKLFAFAKGECSAESSDNPMNQEILLGGHLYLMVLKEKLESWLLALRINIEKNAKAIKEGSAPYQLTSDVLYNISGKVQDVSKGMEYLLATGNLVSKSGLGLMQTSGLTVVADKLNFFRYISHFRAVHRGAYFAEMRTTAVRKLLPESWGFICPVHTPDGAPCGLLNHLSASCQIQTGYFPTTHLLKLLCSLGVSPLDAPPPGDVNECYAVLLDGRVLGYVSSHMAKDVADKLRFMKVKGLNKVPPTMEICLVLRTMYASQYPGLYLFTTPSRMLRPVTNLALESVEMIGTMEQVYLDICINKEEAFEGVTHQELSSTSFLSTIASFTPFSDFNQSPRNMYQCQMGKQTLGTPCHTFGHRGDNKLYRLQTPQSPMVRPMKYDYYDMDNYPLGTNAVVAVISYTGYDMEDAMILNKSSFERGFGHGSIYKSEFVDLQELVQDRGQTQLIFGCIAGDEKTEGKLDMDGLPPVGAYLEENSPFYSYINLQTGEMKVVMYKSSEPACVQQIRILGNDKGTGHLSRICIDLRIKRNPIIGDKFSSRHGQKGICSMLWPLENMPFTESGMTPDIIFNPHGYPSRMTIGMMIESMAGKSASCHGLCHDATPFIFSEKDPAIDYFGKMLVAAGYNYYGTETLYSGVDGRELEAEIFMGVVYYQRLRHMVSDKYQVRTTGPIDTLTHQPVKGRKRAGGIRFGEMERDALIAHGTSFLLQDRLLNCSDKSLAHICVDCGNILSPKVEKPPSIQAAVSIESRRLWHCTVCKKTDSIQIISVPYVFRYLLAELAAMSINVVLDIK